MMRGCKLITSCNNYNMGGNGTKLVTLLKEKRVSEAMALWEESPELKDRFKPNVPIGWKYYRETPMHLVTRAGAKDVLHYLLQEGGDPFVTNWNGETPVHVVCTSVTHDLEADAERSELLKLLLAAIVEGDRAGREGDSYDVIPDSYDDGPQRSPPSREPEQQLLPPLHHVEDRWNLGVVDKARNTPLHLAAASGLERCVTILLDHGAPLFAHNIAGQTPCEAAAQAKHEDIAKLLECKMVLMEGSVSNMTRYSVAIKKRKAYYSKASLEVLRKESVNRLAQKLEIAEFPAEALLQAYGWSEDLVIEAWRMDAPSACKKAGLSTEELRGERRLTVSQCVYECAICAAGICLMEKITVPCGHHVCHTCWTNYLEVQISDGGGKEIRCPSSGCDIVVPNDVLAAVLPSGLFLKYKDLSLKDFVGSCKDMKWCPTPECKYTIQPPEEVSVGDIRHRQRLEMGINVVCGNGHWVCWTCLQEAHEPCSCDLWRRWKEAVGSMGIFDEATDAVVIESERWILGHTKPCPQCSVPIQKLEGCNQVTCRNCGHKFCWLCMGTWESHSQKTGGNFFCNRYTDRASARRHLRDAQSSYEESRKRIVEANSRFMHFYERYQNHLQSMKVEQLLLKESTAKSKAMTRTLERYAVRKELPRCNSIHLDDLASSAGSSAHTNVNFLEDVILVLLHSRRILSSSYALGYFLSDTDKRQGTYESIQGNLEEVVERLSQMVNRPYLCTTHSAMAATARTVSTLCEKYLRIMRRGSEKEVHSIVLHSTLPRTKCRVDHNHAT